MSRSVSTLGLSFALLGVVAWMAAAHPEGGRLFAANATHADVRAAPQPAPSAPPAPSL